jgi:hypothetical protein
MWDVGKCRISCCFSILFFSIILLFVKFRVVVFFFRILMAKQICLLERFGSKLQFFSLDVSGCQARVEFLW